MFQTLAHRKALRGRPDLSRFVPQTPVAQQQVAELLHRGASVIRANQHRVVLKRGAATAEVDALGRVTWRV